MALPILTIENREILKLLDGLQCLDGVSNSKETVERYDFDAVKDKDIGWDIAKDRNIIERAAEVYQKQRTKKAADLGVVPGMKVTPENASSVAKFMEAEARLLDGTQDLIGLIKLSRKHLKAAGVKIPGIYANLMPLINDA